jgi:hypothetical protein
MKQGERTDLTRKRVRSKRKPMKSQPEVAKDARETAMGIHHSARGREAPGGDLTEDRKGWLPSLRPRQYSGEASVCQSLH